MERFTKTLETEYPGLSAAEAAEIRRIAAALPDGKAEWKCFDGVGVASQLQITNKKVTSWSDQVGVDPRIPAEKGGWH